MERIGGLTEDAMPPIIDQEKCKCCGKCVDICSEDVFYDSGKGEVPVVTYPEACWYCNCCVDVCPAEGAIRLMIPPNMMVAYKGEDPM